MKDERLTREEEELQGRQCGGREKGGIGVKGMSGWDERLTMND